MAREEGYTSKIYQGGVSTLEPNYGSKDFFTGYRATGGSLGLTTDPRTANIIKEASSKLSSGVKHMELALVSPEIFDSIPRQQFKEMKQLSKLVGSTVSVHGPVIDSSGIGREGFSEMNRESSERRIVETLNRSHEIDPNGNIVVTFHSAEGIQGSDWKVIGSPETREGKRIIAVNRETGRMIPIEEERKYYPEMVNEEGKKVDLSKGELYSPERSLRAHNATEWDNSVDQVIFNKERADEILKKHEYQIRHLLDESKNPKFNLNEMSPIQKEAYQNYRIMESYIQDVQSHARAFFNKAYKYGTEDQRKVLQEVAKKYAKNMDKEEDPLKKSNAMNELLITLKSSALAPEMNVPIEDFATEQSSKTFGNAAFEAYKKFGDKTPILSIENPPAGFALSSGEDLRTLVKESRKKFIERATSDPKNPVSKSEAEQLAEKFIGATWDVGHINMIRSKGHDEKTIIKESEKIAPFLKHVHLSDNFGFEHTELPMGMGNVPMKEIMQKLGQKGFEAKKVIEAGQWWQHFGEQGKFSALIPSLEGLGSPIYSEGVGPYWNQALGFQQGYMTGLEGNWLPNTNYETFGTGFSRLPQELGGSMQQGTGGRMGGGRE